MGGERSGGQQRRRWLNRACMHRIAAAALWLIGAAVFGSSAHGDDVNADAEFLEYLGRMESADTNWTDVADAQSANPTSKPIKENDSKHQEPDKQQASDQR